MRTYKKPKRGQRDKKELRRALSERYSIRDKQIMIDKIRNAVRSFYETYENT